jgi:hypothetical protein
MSPEDTDKLVDILAWEAFYGDAETKDYFKNLLRESHIPSSFVFEAVALLDDNPETAARNLVDWAEGRGTNPENPDFTILGNLLYPLLPKLGLEKSKMVIQLLFRYRLLSGRILTESSALENSLDDELLLDFAYGCLGEFETMSNREVFRPFLRAITELNDLSPCIEAFLKLFQQSPLKVDEYEQSLSQIQNQSVKLEYRIFILIKLLLEDELVYESPISRMADFATNLKSLAGAPVKKSLNEWLKLVEQEFGYKSVIKASQPKPAKITSRAFLMIVIRKALARGKKFHADAFLLAEHEETQIAEWLILEEENPGPYTLKSLQSRVSSFVLKAEKKLIGIAKFDIAIEIFLPFQYWCEQVDCWPIKILSQDIPIGRNYRIALRAYERITDVIGTNDFEESALLRHQLIQTWENLQSFLETVPTKAELHRRIVRIGREDSCCPTVLEAQLIESEARKYGLVVTCAPPIHLVPKKQREAIFEAALLNGFPIVIWARCEDTADGKLEKTMATCLDKDCLMDFNTLLARLKEKREKSHTSKRGYGRHIAILCDDPNRLPTEPLPLVG